MMKLNYFCEVREKIMDIYEGKIIRDLVHDYFNLTSFELELIDTIPFQRLKDI